MEHLVTCVDLNSSVDEYAKHETANLTNLFKNRKLRPLLSYDENRFILTADKTVLFRNYPAFLTAIWPKIYYFFKKIGVLSGFCRFIDLHSD